MARRFFIGLALAVPLGCGATAPSEPARSFAMGLSDFPNAATAAGVASAYQVISRDGDMAAWFFEDVPWPEALAGAGYAPGFMNEIERRAAATPPGHRVYLSLTPINSARDGIALYRGNTISLPLPPPWNGRSFDHPEVVGAFINHSERMIAATRPQFFSYATEANMLLEFNPSVWPAFVRFAAAVYPRLKAANASMPVFVTLQADTFHGDRAVQTAMLQQILPYTDLIAVSSYPFREAADASRLRIDHFAALRDLAPTKPFAVSETCWPAQDVADPYPYFIPASEETQRGYVERLLREADQLGARFVTWTFSRDYDEYFRTVVTPQERLVLRLFMNCGLYDGGGRARPGLAAWRQWLEMR